MTIRTIPKFFISHCISMHLIYDYLDTFLIK